MADKVTYFPLANDIRMVPYNREQVAEYNYWPFDNAPMYDSLKPGQLKKKYASKVQYSDRKQLAYYTSIGAVVTISIYNNKGVFVENIADPLTSSTLFTYKAENGAEHTLVAGLRRWNFDSGDHAEGIYHIFAHVVYADETTEDFISEPLWVRAKHKDTVVVKYSHSSNEFDVLFQTIGIGFCKRFDSDFMSMEPASEDVVFTDQGDNVRRLFGNPYRVFKLNIGGGKGVPEWEIDKINRAFCCDTFTIDGKRYVKNEGAKFESQTWTTYPLLTSSIELREYKNDSGGAFINTAPVRLFQRGATYPFVHSGWTMYDSAIGRGYTAPPQEFNSEDDEDAWLTYFNGTVVPGQDLYGEFQIDDDGWFIYVNASFENMVVTNAAITLVKYYEITASVITTVFGVYGFEYYHSGTGFHITSWGDGCEKVTEPGNTILGAPIITGKAHVYAASGSKTIRFYTTDTMTVLQFRTQANKVTAIDNTTLLSTEMSSYWLTGQNLNADFDFAPFYPAKNKLRGINLDNSHITGIVPDWGDDLETVSYKPWSLLRTYQLTNNEIPAADLDAFFNEIVDHTDYLSGFGSIDTQGQTPAAPPTGASTSARDTLADPPIFYNIWTD